jgi:hypothetical protein
MFHVAPSYVVVLIIATFTMGSSNQAAIRYTIEATGQGLNDESSVAARASQWESSLPDAARA